MSSEPLFSSTPESSGSIAKQPETSDPSAIHEDQPLQKTQVRAEDEAMIVGSKRPRESKGIQTVEEILADSGLEICIFGLAPYTGKKKLEVQLKKAGICYSKVKKLNGMKYAHVLFPDAEAKAHGVPILRTRGFNGTPLDFNISRKTGAHPLDESDPSSSATDQDHPLEPNKRRVDDKPPPSCIQDVVTPYWKYFFSLSLEYLQRVLSIDSIDGSKKKGSLMRNNSH